MDHGRQAGRLFRKGMRYDPTMKKLIISEEARLADEGMNESNNERMARVCKPLVNDINQDLVFTVESPEEFGDDKLPTLDVKLWLEAGLIRHTYFEK